MKDTSEEICKFNALSLLCLSNLVQEEDEIEGLVICLIFYYNFLIGFRRVPNGVTTWLPS